MAKLIQLERCFFNDKDITDVLSNPRISDRFLAKVGQAYGILFNADESRDSMVRFLSRLPFDWETIQSLAKQLEKPEREERRSVTRLDSGIDSSRISLAVDALKATRIAQREELKVEQSGGKLLIRGSYIEIDHSKSRALQREQKDYMIEIDVADGEKTVQYTGNPKAKEFVQDLVNQLKPDGGPAIDRPIELGGIKDAAQRTAFFLKLRRLMSGMRPVDVLDLKVDNRLEAPSDDEDAEDSKDEQTEEEVKGMVKSAALNGKGLLTSELYQKLQSLGYFVHRIHWTSLDVDGEGRLMEFEAGFENPVEAKGFSYDLRRVIPSDVDKEKGLTQLEVTNRERPRIRRLLVDAAYKALEEITTSSAME